MSYGVIAEGLRKRYGQVDALKGISFSVRPGELFGLIGPDGAGKTTLFRILATLLLPDEGHADVLGLDVVRDWRQIRRLVGYMPGRFSLYQDLSVEENLRFFATIFQTTVEANYDLIRDIYTWLEPFKNRRAGKLSGGMKQKLALCCALIHCPKLLFLDEPTTGVDPVSRVEFWDTLDHLRAQGMTILVSTPYMDEAARCDRIMLTREGEALRTDTPDGIREAYPFALWSVRSVDMPRLLADLRRFPEAVACFAFGDSHHLATPLSSGNISEPLRNYLRELGHQSLIIERIEPGIEDCFMALSQME